MEKRRRIRALITRPKQDAEKSRARLRELGFEVVMEPVLEITPSTGSKPQIYSALLRKPQAIIFSSANGARTLVKYTDDRDFKIITVGNSSADVARNLGFTNVISAGGDVKDLTAVVKKNCTPEKGFLLHVAGNVVAGNMQEELQAEGFEVQKIKAYNATPVKGLTPGLKVILVNCEIDFVIFYSARSAKVFEDLLKKEKIQYLASNIDVFSLSNNIKPELKWKKIYVAEKPNEDSLLDLIDKQTSDKVL